MGKRSQFAGAFKIRGVQWVVRRYKRDGEWRLCYSARFGYKPIFTKDALTKAQIIEHMKAADKE